MGTRDDERGLSVEFLRVIDPELMIRMLIVGYCFGRGLTH